MNDQKAPGPPPGFRKAVLDFKRAMAEVEEVIFAEKAAWLPTLSIQESLAIFEGLQGAALILQRDRTPHPDIEARRVADTIAFRELMARVAGPRP